MLTGSGLVLAGWGRCVFAGHSGGKLLPLPLGPKWQWNSTEMAAEPKAPVKERYLAAGAGKCQAGRARTP
jgi:hypothetical protein